MSESLAQQIGSRLTKVLSTSIGLSYYELLVESEEEAVFSSRKDLRGRWDHAYKVSEKESFVVRLYLILDNGKWVEHIVNLPSESQIETFVVDATNNAQTKKKENHRPRTDSYTIPFRGLEIFDLRYDRMSDDDREEILSWNIETLSSYEGIHPLGIWFTEQCRSRFFVSSIQASQLERSTRFLLKGEAMLNSDNRVTEAAIMSSRRVADVGSRPIGAEIGLRLKSYMQVIPLPKQKLPVIVEPFVASEIIRALLPAFDGNLIAKGKSLLCGKSNELIASPLLHIIDDASLPNGMATRAFDGRGVPSVSLTLIREGRFQDSYQSCELARPLNLRPTGHYDLNGQIWPGNISIKEGRRSRNMISSDIGNHICITHIKEAIHLDIQTGDFKMVANAVLIHADEKKSVGTVVVESSIFDVLKGISEIASDHVRDGDIDISSWLMTDLNLKAIS